MTIRGLPEEVAVRLAQLSRERGQSINAIVVEILKQAMDVRERRTKLERYVTWTDEDLADFDKALDEQRVIDDELWR